MDGVAQFARELACDELRAQVARLMESVGLPPPQAAAARQNSEGAKPPSNGEDICKRDSDELARIRAHPDRDAAARFARDLKCEALKPQAARLLESVGD
jgi:hypothetical protein